MFEKKKFIIIFLILIFLIYPLSKYYYNYVKRKILRKIAINTIILFNKYNIDYWIDFGTLLGIIRENDIIWGDNDIDIVILDTSENHKKMKLVKKDIKKLGYNVTKEIWSAYRIRTYGLFADIYINKFDYKNKIYIGSTGVNSNISFDLIGKPKTIIWKKYNLPVKVPQHIHKTLVWRYGEDYMTPKHNFKGRDS
tara:strand:+ start:588 stop:1172 length:585 start_codon:yes stop_codon:yes gene_type:complete